MSDFNLNEDAQSGGEFSGSQRSNEETPSTSQPSESAFPDEDEDTITMLDVIEQEDKLEEEASAVLGNSDPKNCTYPKGYISRQALYSCITCSEDPEKPAAICLACSLDCHDNHEVYELYTKRNYRCDCGNSKFKDDFECKFVGKQKKLPVNEQNKYNHNFSGRYCICDKRYPPDEADDSAESNDEMLQCVVCEDWYHTKHLDAKDLPDKFDELICSNCVVRLEFVHYYRDQEVLKSIETVATSTIGPEVSSQSTELEGTQTKSSTQTEAITTPESSQVEVRDRSSSPANDEASGVSNNCENDTNDSQAENKDPGSRKAIVSPVSDCILDQLKIRLSQTKSSPDDNNMKRPIFWPNLEWRSKLCKCKKCLEMYKAQDCEYLLDLKDTVQFYEAQGKALAGSSESNSERAISALNRMNRAAVVEALHGYDEMKAGLSDYLKKFADSKKVVRSEDIHEFFQQLKSKKRPRLEFE